jgi:hypothetical protein
MHPASGKASRIWPLASGATPSKPNPDKSSFSTKASIKDSVVNRVPLSTELRGQLNGHVKLMCKDIVDIAHTVNVDPPNDC